MLPNNITSIGNKAFRNCYRLTSVTIPNSVISIGDGAFTGCFALVEIYNLSGLNIVAGSENNGYVGYYAKVVHKSIDEPTSIVKENNIAYYVNDDEIILLTLLDGTQTSITILNMTTSINMWAFCCCYELKSVTIPNSVKSIGDFAFAHCESLSSVTFENVSNLAYISFGAFMYCSNLNSITIPNSVTIVDFGAFNNCSNLTIFCEATSMPSGFEANWASPCPVYWYSEIQPTKNGRYWHYVDGIPTKWD